MHRRTFRHISPLAPLRLLLAAALLALALLPEPGAAFAAPANDNLSGATVIPTAGPFPFTQSVDTTGATRESGETGTCGNFPAGAVNTRSVWYRFVPSQSGYLELDTLASAPMSYNTVVEVFVGAASSPTYPLIPVACNDNAYAGVAQSFLSLPVAPGGGVAYYIVARTFGASGTGGSLALRANFVVNRTIVVDGASGNDAYPGTAALPVRTIGRGVTIAPTDSTLQIAGGTYAEQLDISRNLTFAAAGPVTISGAIPAITLSSGAQLISNGSLNIPSVRVTQLNGPGSTIANALALVQSGGTVEVGGGSFAETVLIDKPLTLSGVVGTSPTIVAPSAAAPAIQLVTGASSVIIGGLNLSGALALDNQSGAPVMAEQNFWGASSGPAAGQTTGTVDAAPWCAVAQPTCTPISSPPEIYFSAQPVDGVVGVGLPSAIVLGIRDADPPYTPIAGPTMPITLTIDPSVTPPSGAQIGGQSSIVLNPSGDTYTLSAAVFNKAFVGYKLRASGQGLTSSSSAAFTIAKATPTVAIVTPVASSFTLDDASFSLGASTTPGGLSVSFSTTSSSSICTVSGTTVTIVGIGSCDIVAATAANADYNAGSIGRSFSIGAALQSVTFAPASVTGASAVYGASFTVSASGSRSFTAASSITSSTPTVCTDNTVGGVTTITVVGVGVCSIDASVPASGSYAAASGSLSFTAVRASQTIAFQSPTPANNASFSATSPDITIATNAAQEGASVTFGAGPAGVCIITGTPGASSASVDIVGVGTCTVTAQAPTTTNYGASTQLSRSFVIGRTAADFSLVIADKVYDGLALTPTLIWTTPAAQPAGSTVTVTYNGLTASPQNVGSYTVAATLQDTTYGGAATPVLVTISPKPIDFSVVVPDKSYDGTAAGPPSFSFVSIDPLPASRNGYTFSYSGSGSTVYGPSAVPPTAAGSYTLNVTTADANFSGAASDDFTIAPLAQTISFAALPDRSYRDAPFAIIASTNAGLPVSFVASGQCSLSGATLTILAAGTCTVTASQAGDSNRQAAADVVRTFTIAKAVQTIVFNALPAARALSNPALTLSATASSGMAVSFSVSGPCALSGVSLSNNALGSCIVTASQAGDSNYAAASVSQTVTIIDAFRSFAPLVTRAPDPADLIGTLRIESSADPIGVNDRVVVVATVTNQGDEATGGFWVDLFVNPTSAPDRANVRWNDRCGDGRCIGAAWYVPQGLRPGESITLRTEGLSETTSRWSGRLPAGQNQLYLYVDSWNGSVPWGAVDETGAESNNRAALTVTVQ